MIDYQKAVCELRDKLVMTQTEFAKYLGNIIMNITIDFFGRE